MQTFASKSIFRVTGRPPWSKTFQTFQEYLSFSGNHGIVQRVGKYIFFSFTVLIFITCMISFTAVASANTPSLLDLYYFEYVLATYNYPSSKLENGFFVGSICSCSSIFTSSMFFLNLDYLSRLSTISILHSLHNSRNNLANGNWQSFWLTYWLCQHILPPCIHNGVSNTFFCSS